MTKPIPPALTAKEWRTTRVDLAYGLWYATLEAADSHDAYLAGTGEVEATGEPAPWLMLYSKSESPNAIVFRRHALAALALHGQPFGFTRKDVALLRAANHANVLNSLIARIEALLPPENAP